jgi:hypothetical protein
MSIKRLTQLVWEDTYSRSEIRSRIKREFESDTVFSLALMQGCEAIKKYSYGSYYESKQARVDWLRSNCVLRREHIMTELMVSVMLNQVSQIQSLVGQLAHHLECPDVWDGIKLMADIIAVVGIETNLYDIVMPVDSETGSMMIEANFDLPEELKQYIVNTKYMPPMLVPPNIIKHNYDKAYLNSAKSMIKGKQNHHDDYIALDVLNLLNQVPLCLDEYVLQYDEVPNTELDTQEKKQQFLRLQISSRKVYQELLDEDNLFHLTWDYDKRGRAYCNGYHVNLQSTDYKKSLISLADKEVVPL